MDRTHDINKLFEDANRLRGDVVDSEPNIRNQLSRGKFTAVFLVQCLEAIGASSLRLPDG
jgi:hypothetical protein